jgi:outer membrane receptor for ferrienterochelin and colicins
MRFRVAGTVALNALFALTLVSAAAAQNGTLSGTVTDDAGGAVNAVDISVRGGGAVFNAQTDAQGRYNLSMPAGTYTLVLTLIGHQQTSYANVRISAGQTTTLDMTMPTLAEALTGIVVSVSKGAETRIEAAATTDVITSREISERGTFNPADHLRGAPGVDVATTGLQNSTIVVRGFNNIFSGALNMLSDYRLAGVPSLRVNLMHFIPTTDEDIERIEVVLGPGSALYGPNTANGVVHMISKSPLDDQSTTVTLGTGAKGTGNLSAFQGAFRTAFLVSPNLGIKVSGQFLDAEEWEYIDPVEQTAKEFAEANPGVCVADKITRGLTIEEATLACGRIGDRNFDITRWSVEARADWRFSDDGTFIATYGRNTSSGIELTGLGAGQINEWVSDFFQGRVNKGRLFAQTYYNRSNSGNSFLLRDGVTLVDRSTLLVGQIQHGFAVSEGRQDFTYGVDYFKTTPESAGRIYGSYENVDGIEEWGAYVQSKTAVSPQLDLIVAGRMDSHSILQNNVFSPRAALVFKPNENHGIRVTYNQAFSTPSALNLFLDIGGGFAPPPIGGLGFTTRAYGSGPNGWSLRGPDGTFEWMRSPFTPPTSGGAAQLVPAQTPLMWQYYVGVLAASGQIDGATAALLASLTPGNADIGRIALDPNSGAITPIGSLDIPDLASTLESNTETFELGWTGVLNNRISISADVYYTTKNDFVSPLLLQTPLLLLNPTDIEAYLTPIVGPGNAAALAVQLPLGVVSSDEVGAQGADLIVSYRNVGDINLWGGDIAFQAFLTDQWILSGTYSHVSDDTFDIVGGSPIALNAPSKKGSAGLAFRDPNMGLNLSTRLRFTSAFPATSAGFVGDVDSATLVDFTAGYAIPRSRAELQLSVSNLFDSAYRSFVGVPEVGRFTMIRVKYDLF